MVAEAAAVDQREDGETMSDPKPCPFCGSQKPMHVLPSRAKVFVVQCSACGATGPAAYDSKTSIDKWNERETAE